MKALLSLAVHCTDHSGMLDSASAPLSIAGMSRFAALRAAAARLPADYYRVDRPVNERGQYQLELAAEFPFAIKRLKFSSDQPPRPLTWHTYLELFVLLSRECRVRMGGAMVTLTRGDVLVMDHLKLHAVVDFPGHQAEALVIRFRPEVVRGLVTAAADHLLLLPFYCQREDRAHVLRGDSAAAAVHDALARLIACQPGVDPTRYAETGSRAHFLVLLHELARHFRAAEELAPEYARQQTKSHRLGRLFEHIAQNYAARISLPEAAAIAGLSKPQFHAVFKKAAGMTLVDYLTQVRLAQGLRLLRETDQSVAEIASHVGFSDQSYFDRRFRQRYGKTPRQFRAEGNAAG